MSLTAHLDQHNSILQVSAVPGLEGLQELQSVTVGVNINVDG